MARCVEKTRPQCAHRKAAGDESQRAIQGTPTTPHARTTRSLAACSPALTPALECNGIFACAACLTAACRPDPAPCSARSTLAHPLPCVDRTAGERNLIVPRGLQARWGSSHVVPHCLTHAPVTTSE